MKVLNDKAGEIVDILVLTLTFGFVAKGLLLIGFVFFGGGAW